VVLIAARETGFAKGKFPKDCPFTWEQAIDENFWLMIHKVKH
jgi:hypothetical protein